MFILTDLSIHWYIFSSDTGYSFGLDFIFLATFLICFLFIAAFTFLCFITASFLIFSFSFWSASFFEFSCSILFIILKFSSEVIQKLWNIFFLIVCFLKDVGTCIKSSKEKLLPILKNLFRLFTKIQVYFFSLLFLSSLVFFTLTTLALPPLTIPATSIFLTSGIKSFKGMFNNFFFLYRLFHLIPFVCLSLVALSLAVSLVALMILLSLPTFCPAFMTFLASQ